MYEIILFLVLLTLLFDKYWLKSIAGNTRRVKAIRLIFLAVGLAFFIPYTLINYWPLGIEKSILLSFFGIAFVARLIEYISLDPSDIRPSN